MKKERQRTARRVRSRQESVLRGQCAFSTLLARSELKKWLASVGYENAAEVRVSRKELLPFVDPFGNRQMKALRTDLV